MDRETYKKMAKRIDSMLMEEDEKEKLKSDLRAAIGAMDYDEELDPEYKKSFPVPNDEVWQAKNPYATKYCRLYGAWNMMGKQWPPPLKGYKSFEDVYRECLDRGCTWQELLDYDPPGPDKML